MDELPEQNAEIYEVEQEIQDLQVRLAELRRLQVQGTAIPDYELIGWDGLPTRLSEHFGDKNQMILIHNMGMSCSYCTLWANGFTGLLRYLERVAAFVMVSPDDVTVQQAGSAARGWKFKMLSTKDSSLFRDMGFEQADGGPWPGMTTIYKDQDGQLRRHSLASFCPGDMFCAAFTFVDHLPYGGDLGLD